MAYKKEKKKKRKIKEKKRKEKKGKEKKQKKMNFFKKIMSHYSSKVSAKDALVTIDPKLFKQVMVEFERMLKEKVEQNASTVG